MSETRTFASLGPTLLARKGGARPAMRSQATHGLQTLEPATQNHELDDLGWNDTGDHADDIDTAEILPLPPADSPAGGPANSGPSGQANASGAVMEETVKPEVRVQQEAMAQRIAHGFSPSSERADVPAIRHAQARTPTRSTKSRRSALEDGRRAAFTLRVDAQRHLKLRLACTINGRSAQQIVTEALDRLLADMPEVEALAAQVKRK